jgi:enoyl-CoA hydratase/carnithine racemase
MAAAISRAMFDLRIANDIARLSLRRPGARNAIPAAAWRELGALTGQAASARALIVGGEGAAFCAGADLADFEPMAGDCAVRSTFRRDMRDALAALAGLPIPTIAAVGGACYGAGVALALACDVRIASPSAWFAITPAKYGISYPQEDVFRLVSLIGPGQAARLLLSAKGVDGAEAARIGLVEFLAEDCEAEAEALAGTIAAGSSASHKALKRGIELARRGMDADDGQDRSFEFLLGSVELAARLEERRARK